MPPPLSLLRFDMPCDIAFHMMAAASQLAIIITRCRHYAAITLTPLRSLLPPIHADYDRYADAAIIFAAYAASHFHDLILACLLI